MCDLDPEYFDSVDQWVRARKPHECQLEMSGDAEPSYLEGDQ